MQITLAAVADAQLVHQIMHEAFAEYLGVLDPPSSAHAETVTDVARALAAGGGALAWLGAAAIGSARYGRQPDHLYIGRIAVRPAYRGCGIGGALVTFLEGHARRLGVPEVRLEVRMALDRNLVLYDRLGYEIREIVPHPRNPEFSFAKLGKRLIP
jgi:ribosomal protein S18 acetylase RimI-like enzyme